MKVIIAGSRSFNDYERLKHLCDSVLFCEESVEIVSGGAKGADGLGIKYAKERGLPLKIFQPDYAKYKEKPKFAPIARNKEMAHYADALIVFWDGKSKGTASMISLAKEQKLNIYIENV